MNTINNVPRELLEEVMLAAQRMPVRGPSIRAKLHALLSTPSPAGVDGCKCSISISVLGDGCRYCQPQEYIDRLSEMLDEERAELSDAQAIIDWLRGEVEVMTQNANNYSRMFEECAEERDQQAQRIGEMEGLLREFAVGISKREMPAEQELNGWFDRIDAALPAGKD